MYELKTKENDNDVTEFIEQVENPKNVKTHINY